MRLLGICPCQQEYLIALKSSEEQSQARACFKHFAGLDPKTLEATGDLTPQVRYVFLENYHPCPRCDRQNSRIVIYPIVTGIICNSGSKLGRIAFR